MRTYGLSSALIIVVTFLQVSYAQQVDVAVTVYNSNVALVKDVRKITVSKGVSTVRFTDVAAQIDPTSVSFSSLSDPEGIDLLEQNYEYDLVNSGKMLGKYIDEEIKLVTKDGKTVRGVLLSSSGADVILRLEKDEIKMFPVKTINSFSFPKLPEGLITKPTLMWMLDSETGGENDVEVRYLTGNITWHAEYVAAIGTDDTKLLLSSWVSVENRSGASYSEAKLKVVAGDVRRIRPRAERRRAMIEATSLAKADGGFDERAFFEYHIYELPRRTTIKNNQVKQIALFEPASVDFRKIYEYKSFRDRKRVMVKLEFRNDEESGLGVPLPMGVVRIYKEDVDGSLEFAGEDRLEHTPKDEDVSLTAGAVFDLKPEWRQTERRKIGDEKWRYTVEIKIRNHKDEEVTVRVVEKLGGSWKVKSASHEYEKKDASTIQFNVKVPSDGESVITYTYESER